MGWRKAEGWMGLTDDELEILRALAMGLTRKQITHCYDVSMNVVKNRSRVIRGKMGARVGRGEPLTIEHCVAIYAAREASVDVVLSSPE